MSRSSTAPQVTPTLVLAGFGEVGQSYARSLLQKSVHLRIYHPSPSEHTKEAAATQGLVICNSALAAFSEADIVLSVAPGQAALQIAAAAAGVLKPDALFADLTSAAPSIIRESAALFAVDAYIDVAIMGAVSIHGLRTPLLASGGGAQRLAAALQPLGFQLESLPGSANGDATSLKILRSIFTKGMDAVVMECMLAAEAAGLRELLLQQLADLDLSTTRELIEMFVRTHVPAAARRKHEAHTAACQLHELGIDAFATKAVQQRYEHTVSLMGKETRNPTVPPGGNIFDAVLPWMLQAERAKNIS